MVYTINIVSIICFIYLAIIGLLKEPLNKFLKKNNNY